MDAGHRGRSGGVDRQDPSVRAGRAQEAHDLVALVGDVIRVAAAAGEQDVVLDAAHRAAAAEALCDVFGTHAWIPWRTASMIPPTRSMPPARRIGLRPPG